MFARFITLLPIAALAAVAVAAPNALEARTAPGPVCSSGSVDCCNQKFSNPSTFTGGPLGLLGVLLGVGANVGVSCTPITVIGALSDGAKCTKQTACCQKVEQNGVVNYACSPINVSV